MKEMNSVKDLQSKEVAPRKFKYPKLKTVQRRFNQLMEFMEGFSAHDPPARNFVWADMRHWHYEICITSESVTFKEMLTFEDRMPAIGRFITRGSGYISLLAIMVGLRTFWICADCSFPLNYSDHFKDGCPNCGDTFPDKSRRIELK